jgi:pyridoxal phosphate enzyme (YggS family)
MPNIRQNIESILAETSAYPNQLVAVSKTKPLELIIEAYATGQLDFGENKVQELCQKQQELPKDIRWHMVGHLQRNKVKQIAPFVHLIHSVDSERLLFTIDNEGKKLDRKINCLLQIHIATESSKFGFDEDELFAMLGSETFLSLKNVNIIGLMGMATFTEDENLIRSEFLSLKSLFETIKTRFNVPHLNMTEMSLGMSGDYMLALQCGSTMIRPGSSIFGERIYG